MEGMGSRSMGKSIPIKKMEDIRAVKEYFLKKGDYRDYCLVTLLLNTSMQIEMLLQLKWKDVCREKNGAFDPVITISHGSKLRRFALNREVCEALEVYREQLETFKLTDYIFQSRYGKGENCPIGRIQVFKLIKRAAEALGLDGNISPQSLRKTMGYQAWEQGYRKDSIMDLYNHSSLERTKRYLHISEAENDDRKLALMKDVNL